jgi:hypothetical protein
VLVPSCRLTHDELQERAADVNRGLRDIAAERGHRFVALDSAWYGFDPIHIRHRDWRTAWSRILDVPADLTWRASIGEAAGLLLRRPQRQTFLGIDIGRRQQGAALSGGGRVWLF